MRRDRRRGAFACVHRQTLWQVLALRSQAEADMRHSDFFATKKSPRLPRRHRASSSFPFYKRPCTFACAIRKRQQARKDGSIGVCLSNPLFQGDSPVRYRVRRSIRQDARRPRAHAIGEPATSSEASAHQAGEQAPGVATLVAPDRNPCFSKAVVHLQIRGKGTPARACRFAIRP